MRTEKERLKIALQKVEKAIDQMEQMETEQEAWLDSTANPNPNKENPHIDVAFIRKEFGISTQVAQILLDTIQDFLEPDPEDISVARDMYYDSISDGSLEDSEESDKKE